MIQPKNIFSILNNELENLNINLTNMIGARHPILYAASQYLFNAGGKRIRPIIIMLISQATSNNSDITSSHKRLAEITEIIHTASLLHDDIIDECTMRRGINTVHNTFNTKIAVLAGDFLFAQSSWYLANLNNLDVVKTISKVITDFAEGEVRQGLMNFDIRMSIHQYIEKSFYKTASLIAASCKSAAILNKNNIKQQNACYIYGKHIGLAFQIIDDILDITGSTQSLGKSSSSDLKNGNFTAPVLFALIDFPLLQTIINQEFENEQDMFRALNIIKQSQGIKKAKDLAEEHIQASLNNLKILTNIAQANFLLIISKYILERIY
uniref:Prenyl transferase n=1 Tax=Thorea hispida TaxID=202687 RepID=A0A1Z1XAK2_9FLOR|nr:prenyl transferase [Thorea hispida]